MNARAELLGLVRDMPFEDYLAVDAVSVSALKHMARSAWHYRNRVPVIQTRPMLRGTLAHCAVLEPTALQQRFAVVPDDAPRRPTRAQWNAKKPSPESVAAMQWWTLFQHSCADREIVTTAEYLTTQLQLAALAAEATIAETLSTGYGECSIFWHDEATGLYCKARPDWVHPLNARQVDLFDLKSTADESPSGFGRAAARLKYDLQAAHYVEGFELATGLKVRRFIFGAVTSAPPVLAVPYILTDEIAEQGRDERRELLDRLAWCHANQEWPTYGAGVQLLDYPAYAKRNSEVEVSFADD